MYACVNILCALHNNVHSQYSTRCVGYVCFVTLRTFFYHLIHLSQAAVVQHAICAPWLRVFIKNEGLNVAIAG